MARVLETAGSLKQVNAVLHDNTDNFGFAHMEVCRESDRTPARSTGAGSLAMTWKVDYPVVAVTDAYDDPHVLRIRCAVSGPGSRPYGAERVASILAPAVQEWMEAFEVVPGERVVREPARRLRVGAA